jgi:hypothetical protein
VFAASHADNPYNFANGHTERRQGTVHTGATPSTTVDATYRGPLRDGFAYTGGQQALQGELMAEGDPTLLTHHCSKQSIRGSKWDYAGSETMRRYVQRGGVGWEERKITKSL